MSVELEEGYLSKSSVLSNTGWVSLNSLSIKLSCSTSKASYIILVRLSIAKISLAARILNSGALFFLLDLSQIDGLTTYPQVDQVEGREQGCLDRDVRTVSGQPLKQC